MVLGETRWDETRKRMGKKRKSKTGGTRGLLLTVPHAYLYSSNVSTYSLDYLPVSLTLSKGGNTKSGWKAIYNPTVHHHGLSIHRTRNIGPVGVFF